MHMATAGRVIGLPPIGRLAPQSLVAADGEVSATARTMRRSLVFGGLLFWLVVALLAGSYNPDGSVRPAQYPVLGIACFLEARIAVGIAWYVMSWERIPKAVRGFIMVWPLVFTVGVVMLGIAYLLGVPPASAVRGNQ
jgi:hypothetical protein